MLSFDALSCVSNTLRAPRCELVLCVFNEKVVALLKQMGYADTAIFIQQVLEWWNVVNVGSKGEESRLCNSLRAVQEERCESLLPLLSRFSSTKSCHGNDRRQ